MERTIVAHKEHVVWNIPKDYEGITSYNPRHDIQDYLDLLACEELLGKNEFTRRLLQLNSRVERQLITRLGERYSVAESTINFSLENGTLKNPDYDEPVIIRYKKGQQFLRQNGSRETDREDAEVEGIEKVQQLLQNLKTHETIVVISPKGPKGSLYGENLFDTWQKDRNGTITFTRYHSTLFYKQFQEAAKQLDQNFPETKAENLTAAHFLNQPLKTLEPKEEILRRLATTADTIPQKDFETYIVGPTRPYIHHYIAILAKTPLAINEVNKSFHTIINISQENHDLYQKHSKLPKIYSYAAYDIPHAMIVANINYYGTLPVKLDTKGCPGGSKTFKVNQPSLIKNLAIAIGARSVADFAPFAGDEDEDTDDFPCGGTMPDGSPCTYIVRYGSGIKKCPQCGNEAKCG